MTTREPISSVIFDVGGVIADWNPHYLYRRLIPDPAERERFLTEVCTGEWNAHQDRGRPFGEAVAELVTRHPEHRNLIEAFWRQWPKMLGDPIPGVADIVTELHGRRTPLYGITNWSAETYPIAVRKHPELTLFADTVISGEVRMSKPDPEIFRYSLKRFEIIPEQTVFIDDNPDNIAAAEALGINGVHFTDAATLRAVLERLDLLLSSHPASRPTLRNHLVGIGMYCGASNLSKR